MGKAKGQTQHNCIYMDNLFELIRNEEVVIWAGAGLSISAGYPSGKKLGEILFQNLSNSEKKQIGKNLLLPDLAEEIYRIKGHNKNWIIRILKKTFIDTKPKTKEFHDKIALIPHFKTIITTNYDNLFEDSFGDKAQLLLSNSHIGYVEKNKTEIFKVHGDLTIPESIIITKSDYNNFFSLKNGDDVYWTVIKERLSTNSVLFLGYNLEDPNVSVIFEQISNVLASHRKECFLIAPNLKQHKINDLGRKGIKYINITAEKFIDSLILNLKEHIISDLESGRISADSFRTFLLNFNLFPELKIDKEFYKIKTLYRENGSIEGKMNLSLKFDEDFKKRFNDFMTGKTIGKLEISSGNLIKGDLWLGGFKLNNFDGTSKIEFKSLPRYDTLVDIRFEDGFEISQIPVKVYSPAEKVEIHIELKNAKITLQLEFIERRETKVNFNYKHSENCRNTSEEIELFTFLRNLGSGKIFTIYIENGKSFTKSLPLLNPIIDDSSFYLQYFQKLKEIETYFNVRFSNINIRSITASTYDDVLFLISIIKGESHIHKWDGETQMELFDYSQESLNELNKINTNETPALLFQQEPESFELHGQNINIGYKTIEIVDPLVYNISRSQRKKDKNIWIKSKIQQIKVSYSKTNEP